MRVEHLGKYGERTEQIASGEDTRRIMFERRFHQEEDDSMIVCGFKLCGTPPSLLLFNDRLWLETAASWNALLFKKENQIACHLRADKTKMKGFTSTATHLTIFPASVSMRSQCSIYPSSLWRGKQSTMLCSKSSLKDNISLAC